MAQTCWRTPSGRWLVLRDETIGDTRLQAISFTDHLEQAHTDVPPTLGLCRSYNLTRINIEELV